MQTEVKPKMMMAIDHLDAANNSMNNAMQVLSSIVLDLQKGADFLVRYRNSLIKTVELSGGDMGQAVESQIKDYIGKKLNGQDQEVKSGQ